MQSATPIRSKVSPFLMAVVLASLVLSPALHAAPAAPVAPADGPAWAQRLPDWLLSWAGPFLDLLPGSGDAATRPVSVHDTAGSSIDPNG